MPVHVRLLVATVLVAAAAVVGLAQPAQAAAYRYWTYWEADASGWTFASAGPATTVPADGAVEGWRFAVTTAAGGAAAAPGTAPSFEDICGGTAPVPGRKRVALVIDSGPAAIAPEGQLPPVTTATCVVADPEDTGYAVLRTVATVRTEGGLVCAIADYPAAECAPAVDEALATATTTPVDPASPAAPPSPASPTAAMDSPAADASGSGTPWITVGVLTVVLAVGLLLWARGRTDRRNDGRRHE